jgi:hypothetical protein
MVKFPFDVWLRVPPSADSRVDAVKVVRQNGGGYLVITRENGVEFDAWIETLEDVEADLQALRVQW